MRILGVNGCGRIGKLSVWEHIGKGYFEKIVINVGREIGRSFNDFVHYLERDSSYGRMQHFLFGQMAGSLIENVDNEAGIINIQGGPEIKVLREARNPKDIAWRKEGVRLVVDTTGQFLDPTLPADYDKGSVMGHLEAGAIKVIVSAPFKIKDKRASIPDNAVTTVMGINDNNYDPRQHDIVSNASCTTTCLAHMMLPLIRELGAKRIMSASMATVHAATGSQEVLDKPPGVGKEDLRKNRSVMDNIILTTTGAAKALELVIPEMKQIGFIAESVRVPTATGSLIILVVNIQEKIAGNPLKREDINAIYKRAAQNDEHRYLHYTDKQNVSSDIVGYPRAATIIEGHETHTRTAEIPVDLSLVSGVGDVAGNSIIRVPVTQAVIYGWYDNEMGSYVRMLGDRTVSVEENM